MKKYYCAQKDILLESINFLCCVSCPKCKTYILLDNLYPSSFNIQNMFSYLDSPMTQLVKDYLRKKKLERILE